MRANGKVYVQEEDQYLRILLPPKYEHVASLFKAIEAHRSGLLQRQRSMDRHYPVRPRLPVHHPVGGQAYAAAADNEFDYLPRRASAHYMTPTRSASPVRSPRSSQARFANRGSRESQDSTRWSGSLFNDDQLAQQQKDASERMLHYRRRAVPTFRQSRTWE
jgi:hypothetical protein